MNLKFYEIDCVSRAHFLKGEIQLDKDLDIIEFNEYYANNCLYFEKPFKEFEIDNTYFIIKNDEEPFGIIALHKGFTFIDCAEHDVSSLQYTSCISSFR